MKPQMRKLFSLLCLIYCFSSPAFAQATSPDTGSKHYYDVEYVVKFLPKHKKAEVEIVLNHKNHVREINFNLENSLCSRFKSEDTLIKTSGKLSWLPNTTEASLKFKCKINHKRNGDGYDAYINKHWAIFRGDDLIPSARVRTRKGSKSRALLRFDLPPEWDSVNTGWKRKSNSDSPQGLATFIIDNPERNFDRPTGWMIAGQLGTRRSTLRSEDHRTYASVSAPQNSNFRRMDTLAFVRILWPSFESALNISQKRILVVGADDPLWRGGLSAGNSLYIHSERPLISENGTSTLAHELFHMLTGISGAKNDDWIAEGLAEYYSIEFLYRSGATDTRRKQKTFDTLKNWSKDIKTLRGKSSSGKITAAAALLFQQLDQEIKDHTKGKKNLDDLVNLLIDLSNDGEKISTANLKSSFKKVTGNDSSTLNSKLLNRH